MGYDHSLYYNITKLQGTLQIIDKLAKIYIHIYVTSIKKVFDIKHQP